MGENKTLKKTEKSLLINYSLDVEKTPFSDLEAHDILGINKDMFIRGVKLGVIKRSVSIHYRADIKFSFMGVLDLLDYFLRKQFFFAIRE